MHHMHLTRISSLHTERCTCPYADRCTADYCPLTPFRRQESGPLCPYLVATQQPYETPWSN